MSCANSNCLLCFGPSGDFIFGRHSEKQLIYLKGGIANFRLN